MTFNKNVQLLRRYMIKFDTFAQFSKILQNILPLKYIVIAE